jgi:hypothetical protein
VRAQLLGKLIEQVSPDISMCHLPAPEAHGQLDLVPRVEKLRRLPALGRQVVIVDLWTEANFFELDDVLILARLAILPALFVPELPVVHQPTDGRNRIGRDLD